MPSSSVIKQCPASVGHCYLNIHDDYNTSWPDLQKNSLLSNFAFGNGHHKNKRGPLQIMFITHCIKNLAADASNTKCANYYDEKSNGLSKDWTGVCWLNPPYGDKESKLVDWIRKCYEESQNGDYTISALIPVRSNTKWWHEYCMKKSDSFVDGLNSPTPPTVCHNHLQSLCSKNTKERQSSLQCSYKNPLKMVAVMYE